MHRAQQNGNQPPCLGLTEPGYGPYPQGRRRPKRTVCVPMWVGGQAGGPHTPTNMVRGLGLVPGPRFLLTIGESYGRFQNAWRR